MQPNNPVPVLLVTGFQNSGKSTVISHLLSLQKKFALFTNNFRQHSKPPNLPALHISFDKACLCCSENDDVASQLTKCNNVDYIIIESFPTCRVRKIAKMLNGIPDVK